MKSLIKVKVLGYLFLKNGFVVLFVKNIRKLMLKNIFKRLFYSPSNKDR